MNQFIKHISIDMDIFVSVSVSNSQNLQGNYFAISCFTAPDAVERLPVYPTVNN